MFQIENWQDAIGAVMFCIAILLALLSWACHWLARGDEQYRFDNPLDTDRAVAVPPVPVNERANVAEIMMHMGLRRTLPEVVKAEQQEWPIDTGHIDKLLRKAGASDAERADILRGTKLS